MPFPCCCCFGERSKPATLNADLLDKEVASKNGDENEQMTTSAPAAIDGMLKRQQQSDATTASSAALLAEQQQVKMTGQEQANANQQTAEAGAGGPSFGSSNPV